MEEYRKYLDTLTPRQLKAEQEKLRAERETNDRYLEYAFFFAIGCFVMPPFFLMVGSVLSLVFRK